MKRLSALIIFVFAFACATHTIQPTLKNYQANSPDEAKIIDLILELQKAYDTQNLVKILAVYSHDAMLQTSTGQEDCAGVMLSKVEYANELVKQIEFYKKCQIKLEIAPPEKIQVQGGEAHMSSTYELYARNPHKAFKESGVINFEFKKIASGWLVGKRTWEVKKCNHPDFKEWKSKQK